MARTLLTHVPGRQRHYGLSYEAQRMVWNARALCGTWLLCPWDWPEDTPGLDKQAARWVVHPWPAEDESAVPSYGGPVDAAPVNAADIEIDKVTCKRCRNAVLGMLHDQKERRR